MILLVDPAGRIRTLYDECIDLAALGRLAITRASRVEPDAEGRWTADLRVVDGPVLGPYDRRSTALEAEKHWLEADWLHHGRSIEPTRRD